jgi:hypothetical protein
VIAAFHWNVPVGRRGVSISSDGGSGFSDTLWAQSSLYRSHAENLGTLLGPLAEYECLKGQGAAFDETSFLFGCRSDFHDIINSPEFNNFCDGVIANVPTEVLQGGDVASFAAERCGSCFLSLWTGCHSPNGVDAAIVNLAREAETLLRAYWNQIGAFAKVLLSAETHRLSEGDVNTWRIDHFQRCGL